MYWFDTVLVMGHRISLYIAQRISSAIKYIHEKNNMFLWNYVDDFLRAEHENRAQQAYNRLGNILADINLLENTGKAVALSSMIEFLGVTFNSQKMTMEVSPHRVQEVTELISNW